MIWYRFGSNSYFQSESWLQKQVGYWLTDNILIGARVSQSQRSRSFDLLQILLTNYNIDTNAPCICAMRQVACPICGLLALAYTYTTKMINYILILRDISIIFISTNWIITYRLLPSLLMMLHPRSNQYIVTYNMVN